MEIALSGGIFYFLNKVKFIWTISKSVILLQDNFAKFKCLALQNIINFVKSCFRLQNKTEIIIDYS